MAFTCGFFNSVSHDRKYDAVQHGMIFDGIITDGIYATYLKAMVVKASENASEVIVQPGRAWFNHTWSYNDSDYPVAAPEPEVVLDRIDTLVLDVNSEDAVRNNQFLWVQGTPTSQTPEPPTLIHTATHNQYPLCDVYRQAGTTMIYAADITNRVGTSDCPFVTGVLESIDIDDLLAQWDDEFHTWENATKASFEGWMLNQQQVYTAWFNALKTQMAGDVADVEAWVQTIKDIIDEETATHLQLEIDEINSMLPSGSHITVTTSDTELYSRTVTITDEDNNTVTSQFDANGVAVFKSVPYVGSLTITSTDGVRTATEVVNTPYFARYEFTLAFWSATVNIIGDSVFGGDTVTITDSTTALVGTVVLNASGTGVFNATYPDTYKFSVTHGGETMEVSLAVTQETTYNVEIHSGLNYQAWLNAGRVSKSFSSLDDVLADEQTLRQLFLVHDAVDYVASQRVNNDLTKIFNTDLAAKWINNSDYALDTFYAVADIKTVMDTADKYGYGEWCLMPQVPKMTSNTDPRGEAFSNVVYGSGYEAYKAFDGDDATAYSSPRNTATVKLGYKSTNPICVRKVRLLMPQESDQSTVSTVVIQGSNDNSVWEDIKTETINSNVFNDYIDCSDNTDYYLYHQAVFTVTIVDNSHELYVRTLQFYSYAPKGNVPVMTANTAPYGEALFSSRYDTSGSFEGYRAFNDTPSKDAWVSSPGAGTGAYLGYKFTNPICVKKIQLTNRNDNTAVQSPKNFKIQASNDGSSWTDLGTFLNANNTYGGVTTYNIDNDDYYLYYRLYVVDVNTTGSYTYVAIAELQFYGRSLSVSVPTMTSNTAPFGEVFANSETSSTYAAWKAFDNDESAAMWMPTDNTAGYLGYDFKRSVLIQKVVIVTENDSHRYLSSGAKIQGYDGSNWVDIYTINESVAPKGIYDIRPTDAYKKYRLSNVTGVTWPVGIMYVQFYGLDYSEKEFEVGTTKKWLYDHGVELVTFEKLTTGNGWTPLSGFSFSENSQKTPNSLYIGPSASANMDGLGLNTAIDITSYTLFRFINDGSSGDEDVSYYFRTSKSVIATTAYIYSSNNKGSGLDVSSLNGNIYLLVFSSNSTSRKGEVYELWLE